MCVGVLVCDSVSVCVYVCIFLWVCVNCFETSTSTEGKVCVSLLVCLCVSVLVCLCMLVWVCGCVHACVCVFNPLKHLHQLKVRFLVVKPNRYGF